MREDGRKRVCIVSLKEVHCLCYLCYGCMPLDCMLKPVWASAVHWKITLSERG